MMGSAAWKKVWDNRSVDPTRGSTLSRLMAADGLDTSFGEVDEAAWTSFVRRRAADLGMTPGCTVFEVGCGAGAFLYELDKMGCSVSGIDQSAALIQIARETFHSDKFDVADAATISTEPAADFVISVGVFLYFPSLEYASEVIKRMTKKARRAVAILDIPDQAKQEAALRYRIASAGGEQAYEARYQGLDHLYYDRAWIIESLRACGLTDIHTADQDIPGYGNAPFRFNAWGFVSNERKLHRSVEPS